MIELIHVTKTYGDHTVFHDISLTISAGERVVIFGPSGCGKTTLLRLLAGFLAPDSGSIAINGVEVASKGRVLVPPEKRDIGMVFQDLALWPHLSVRENLEFGLKARKVPKEEREDRIKNVLNLIRLTSRMDARPATLSGGQQQRVALARALVLQPKILLMDEPLSNLDSRLNRVLRGEILHLHRQIGFTLVYVTHNEAEASEIGTRIVEMEGGEITRDTSTGVGVPNPGR